MTLHFPPSLSSASRELAQQIRHYWHISTPQAIVGFDIRRRCLVAGVEGASIKVKLRPAPAAAAVAHTPGQSLAREATHTVAAEISTSSAAKPKRSRRAVIPRHPKPGVVGTILAVFTRLLPGAITALCFQGGTGSFLLVRRSPGALGYSCSLHDHLEFVTLRWWHVKPMWPGNIVWEGSAQVAIAVFFKAHQRTIGQSFCSLNPRRLHHCHLGMGQVAYMYCC